MKPVLWRPFRLLVLLSLLVPTVGIALGRASGEDLHFPVAKAVRLGHLTLNARVDLEAKTLAATATLSFTPVRELSTLRLDAVGLEVSAVRWAGDAKRLGGKSASLPFRNDGQHLEIDLPTLQRGEEGAVSVDYSVHNPSAGLTFRGPSKAEPNVPYQVWSQGETITNRYWIPILDQPDERLTSELIVTVKGGLQVLSNGALVEHTKNDDGTETFHWQESHRLAPYLITLVVGKFAIERDTWRGIPISYWVPPDRAADTDRSFAHTKDMLDFFSDKIGVKFPWEKYAQVVVEQFTHGGMENASATTLTERTLHDKRAHLDYSSDSLVSHEMAHQWFGDLLTCKDWADVWLNEGFASYFEALYDEHSKGEDEFAYNMLDKMRGALAGGKQHPIVWRGYTQAWQQFDARAYPKGAWVLHMLRRRLGDDLFWKGIHHYVVKYRDSCVDTDQLRLAFEEATGVMLGRFFYDWTERPGAPVVSLSFRWNAEKKMGEISLKQTQKADAFHFPLQVEFRFSGKEPPRSWTLDVADKQLTTWISLPQAPSLVRIDPRQAVLMELNVDKGRDLWLTQLSSDPSPVLRIRAAEHFGQSRSDADRKALADAYGKEPFWAVRAEIAGALGKSGGAISRNALLAALSSDKNPKARRAVAEALGHFPHDAKVEAALAAAIQSGDASYRVEAAEIESWGRHRAKNALELLKPILAQDSHEQRVRRAALSAIGKQLDPAAVDLLLGYAARGQDRYVRSSALDALGSICQAGAVDSATTKKIVTSVEDCLDEQESRPVKDAASSLLRDLGAQAAPATAALEALVDHDPSEDVRKHAQTALDKIRAGAPPNLQLQRLQRTLDRLRKSAEELAKRVRALENKR